jgi:hypothetical protein
LVQDVGRASAGGAQQMRRILTVIGVFACVVALRAADGPKPPDVAAFDRILKSYVLDDGTVKYDALKNDFDPLAHFVEEIGAVSPDSHPSLFPSREHKLAYWLNAYNALVLWVITKEYPEKKDRLATPEGQDQFFLRTEFKTGGRIRSLNDIENTMRMQFMEPRIHFAIVCASKGCPWLPRDAFTVENLEEQLESRTKLFLNQDRAIRVDSVNHEVGISQIFDWYKKDFGNSTKAMLDFIGKYRPADREALQQGTWKISYLDYDWGINEANKP